LALVAVYFLEGWQPAEEALPILAEQQLPLTGEPLYSQHELSHLRNVKQIADAIRILALATAVPVSSGLLFLLRRPHTRRLGYLALGQGGLLTVMLLSGLAGLILFGWGFFFYQFHGLLFSSGSWTFGVTDSLMRLYPEQFFFNVAAMMSGGTWLLGFGSMLIGYFWARCCAQTEKQKRLVTYVAKTV
jgi:integral membrane protein (TIGR01906 family)